MPIFEQSLISVSHHNDVWVVHSGEEDNISNLARKHNATFLPYHWNGQYPKKRQWCLENVPTKTDWVFFLDADELMFPTLEQEIASAIETQKSTAGFFIKSGYVWDGRPLKYGLKNNKIVLLNKKHMHYPPVNDLACEEMGEIEGHYQPVLKDPSYKIRTLKAKTDHFAFIDKQDWNKRHLKYAKWEAYIIKNSLHPKDPSKIRELAKIIFRRSIFRPQIAFLHCYIHKMGILDGYSGFELAKHRYKYYKMVTKNLKSL